MTARARTRIPGRSAQWICAQLVLWSAACSPLVDPGPLPPASAASVEGRRVTAEDVLAVAAEVSRRYVQKPVRGTDVSDVSVAFDDRHFAWTPDDRALLVTIVDSGKPWIERIGVETGDRRRLMAGFLPHPSPDGERIAYIGSDGVLRVAGADGSGPRAVHDSPQGFYLGLPGHGTFAFAPDSERIAYALPSTDPRHPPGSMELWVLDLDSDQRRLLHVAHLIDGVTWHPRGDRVVFATGELPAFDTEIRAVSPDTGRVDRIAAGIGAASILVGPSVSPDGARVAFYKDVVARPAPEFWDVAVAPVDGGVPAPISRGVLVTNLIASRPAWTPGGDAVVFSGKTAALDRELFLAPMGRAIRRFALASLWEIGHWRLSPDGSRVAFRFRTASDRRGVAVASLDLGSPRVVLDLTPGAARGVASAAVEEVRFFAPDGLPLSGLYVHPIGAPGGPPPLIVDVHGGPQGGVRLEGQVLNATPLELQYWATLGYAVFAPDYRSSRVGGWDPSMDSADPRRRAARLRRDFEDVMAGIDAMVARGLADPSRLALIGHSYGASIANYALFHSDRFAAIVGKEGGVDPDWRLRLDEVETPALFVTSGPMDAGRTRTEAAARALKERGVDVACVHYPDDEHVLIRPENQRDLLKRVTAFLQHRLPPPGP